MSMPARRGPRMHGSTGKEGGRLILPLTADRFSEPRRAARGRVSDRAARSGNFCAADLRGRDLSLWGGRDEASEQELAAAFDKGGAERVTRLYTTRRFAGRPMLAARAWLVSGLPLMHPTFYIRLARVEEEAALSDPCFRSKPEFMALMPAALEVVPEHIAAGDV
jgi:hypothetical protein